MKKRPIFQNRSTKTIPKAARAIIAALLILVCASFALFLAIRPHNGGAASQTSLSVKTAEKSVSGSSSSSSQKPVSSSSENKSSSSAVSSSAQTSSVSQQSSSSSSKASAVSIILPLRIRVDTSAQRVFVYDAKNKLVKEFVCSTGTDGNDTPKGNYTVQERGYSFFSEKYQEGAYYWVQFYGNYLFHSVPFDKGRKIEAVEAAKLGTKASHGCVRLSIENAKWMYVNIPRGTKVVIE